MSDALRKAAILPLLLAAGVQPSAAAPAPAFEAAELCAASHPGAVEPVLPAAPRERCVGPYRLLHPLGSGGMGTVYLAESSAPPRRVALKVLRADRREAQLAARMEVERRALAAAEHEFIARLYESGVTDEDGPWLALELVDGEPITEFCDRRQLDVEARLGLFTDVCAAVQHLHERGILHCDLKPANILVCARGPRFVPKIIDLGLARLREAGDGSAGPGDDCVMGTPAYMAPEQLTLPAPELDARCDVFALALVLRDLLVGARPTRGALDAVLHSALDGCPPSAQLRSPRTDAASVARQRSTSVTALRRRLRGSLDRIAERAGARRREERHDSAAALGAEVERDLRCHAARGHVRRGLALATLCGAAGVIAGFLAAGL